MIPQYRERQFGKLGRGVTLKNGSGMAVVQKEAQLVELGFFL